MHPKYIAIDHGNTLFGKCRTSWRFSEVAVGTDTMLQCEEQIVNVQNKTTFSIKTKYHLALSFIYIIIYR